MTVIGPDGVATLAFGNSSAGHEDLSFIEPVVAVGGRSAVPLVVVCLCVPCIVMSVLYCGGFAVLYQCCN